MITWKMTSNMSDSVFLNRLIVFILLMSGGSTFSQTVEEKIPSPREMIINNNETTEIFDEDLSETTDDIRYVSDEFYVPLRRTPCSDCTIVHRGLKSGTKIKLIMVDKGWGFVETENGKQGWMEEQFVITSPSGRSQLSNYTKSLKDTKELVDSLSKKNSSLEEQVRVLKESLLAKEMGMENETTNFDNVLDISAESGRLIQQNKELIARNQTLRNANDVLKVELDIQRDDTKYKSFLYGGITVFLGALLTIIIPKLKGRRRFSEWG